MPPLSIVHYPDPLLLKVGKPVSEGEFTPQLESFVDDMFETMYAAGGVGLAAPQVNDSRRLFVMDVPDEAGESNKIVFANPAQSRANRSATKAVFRFQDFTRS